MTEQAPEPVPVSPTVALIDARLNVLVNGESSIGIQEVQIARLRSDLAAAEERLAGCLAEKTQLETDRAVLVPTDQIDEPTDPEVSV